MDRSACLTGCCPCGCHPTMATYSFLHIFCWFKPWFWIICFRCCMLCHYISVVPPSPLMFGQSLTLRPGWPAPQGKDCRCEAPCWIPSICRSLLVSEDDGSALLSRHHCCHCHIPCSACSPLFALWDWWRCILFLGPKSLLENQELR